MNVCTLPAFKFTRNTGGCYLEAMSEWGWCVTVRSAIFKVLQNSCRTLSCTAAELPSTRLLHPGRQYWCVRSPHTLFCHCETETKLCWSFRSHYFCLFFFSNESLRWEQKSNLKKKKKISSFMAEFFLLSGLSTPCCFKPVFGISWMILISSEVILVWIWRITKVSTDRGEELWLGAGLSENHGGDSSRRRQKPDETERQRCCLLWV